MSGTNQAETPPPDAADAAPLLRPDQDHVIGRGQFGTAPPESHAAVEAARRRRQGRAAARA